MQTAELRDRMKQLQKKVDMYQRQIQTMRNEVVDPFGHTAFERLPWMDP